MLNGRFSDMPEINVPEREKPTPAQRRSRWKIFAKAQLAPGSEIGEIMNAHPNIIVVDIPAALASCWTP